MNLQKLSLFERRAGGLRLLVFLLSEKEAEMKKIIYGADLNASSAYASLELLKEMGLVKTRIDQTKYPARNMISLTEKGKTIAEKLKEIEELLA